MGYNLYMSKIARRMQLGSIGNTLELSQNLLIGKVFTSDVSPSTSEPGHPIASATDQNNNTRWISEPQSPVTLTADLGGVYDLTNLVIVFAGDTIQNYTISVSTNGSGYTQIASGTTNNTQKQTVTISSFSNTPKGRYLRIYGTDRWNQSYGNSIWEVEAYGTLDSNFPTGSITNFSAAVISDTQINLTWNYSGSPLTNFTLQRNGSTISNPSAGSTSFNNTGLSQGTSYTYTLTGNYSAGGTTNSATTSATTTGGVVGGLPTNVVSVWHHRWSGPNLRDYPTDVKGLVNHVVLGLAQSGGSGTGNLYYTPNNGQSVADHAADIRTFVAAGTNVLMGFGGSSDGGITITNNTQADQAYDSMVGFVNTYGINGIDVDLEPSGSSWTESALKRLCGRLKSTYGQNFIIGLTPGLYGEHTARWMSAAQLLGDDFDYMSPMLYDFIEASDSRLTAVSLDKCNTMAAAGIPDSKMMLGFMCRPYPAYTNASPTPQITIDAYNAVKAARPNLRGAFIWEDLIENDKNWQWVRAAGPIIRS